MTNNSKENFIEQIKKNLEINGFPHKKVSFDLMKMYEVADDKGFSFNDILLELESEHSIEHEKSTEKIIFSLKTTQTINNDMFTQAQDIDRKSVV